jgi:hypothetical protein
MIHVRRRWVVGGVMAGLTGAALAATGCTPRQTDSSSSRAQAEYDPEKDQSATVGSKTVMGNTEPIPVSGVGLVYQLKGTGSSPPADGWRETLEKALKKRRLNPKEVLDDPARSTSLVLVSGVIPPGARNGDRFDLTVTLPGGSKTASLQHGVLDVCDLTNYELSGSLKQSLANSGVPTGKVPQAAANELLMGNRVATAEGPLVAGVLTPVKAEGAGDAPASDVPAVRAAKVWGGMTNLIDRPYHFLLNGDAPQPRLAMVVAARMNAVFHGTSDKAGKVAEAQVQGRRPMITAFVPPTYRLNHHRFILVARNIPLTAPGANDPYRKKLERELLQPETAVLAAIKLEALGADSEDALRVGLEHADSPWVRFAAAQSLCYLGKADPKAARTLSEIAERHPALRTHALTALASQDDAPCLDQLVELMKKGGPALRYGAFAALRGADENHDAVRGRRMGHSYWLHAVAADSTSLVHLTSERRNEVVLFGSVWPVSGTFAFPLGTEFTVTRKEGEESVTVSRVVTKDGEPATVEAKYRADLGAILKGLAEMGGTYAEAVEFVRRVHAADGFGFPVAVDAVPRGFDVQELARLAGRDPLCAEADKLAEKSTGVGEVTPTGGFDLPNTADELTKPPEAPPPPAPKPGLNRTHGSFFDNWK